MQLKARATNVPSRRAIERIGAKFEGLLRNYAVAADGTSADSAMYSVIREDWPEVKRHIRQLLR